MPSASAMPRVVLAPALARWIVAAGDAVGERVLEVNVADVAGALAEVFARFPQLRGYVVDEHGAVRHHVTLFVDGSAMRDKTALDQPLRAELYVMQALSGG